MTREDIVEITILSRYLSLLSHDCYSFVVNKSPKNGLEAAKYVQKYEETRSFGKRQQPWRNGNSQSNNQDRVHSQILVEDPAIMYYGYRRPPSYNGEQTGSGNSGNIIKTSPQEQSGGRQANGGKVKSNRTLVISVNLLVMGVVSLGILGQTAPIVLDALSYSSVVQVDGLIVGKPAFNLRFDTGAEKQ